MAIRDDLRNRTTSGSNTTLGVAIGVGAVLVLGLWFFTPVDVGTSRTSAPTSQSEKTNSPGTSSSP